jgi:hydrogenase maturation protein HypF
MNGITIRVKGKIQGVGFRPFVWQLAYQMRLNGDVRNDGEGVLIRLVDPNDATPSTPNSNILQRFETELTAKLPRLARIDSIARADFYWPNKPVGFNIAQSQSTLMNTQVVPDASTCSECRRELMDILNRRYYYPLINCTHCGPRFTIISSLPYDRANTVMADFPLCPVCESEYYDPIDRRYHAQPVACECCGPKVYITDDIGRQLDQDWLILCKDAIAQGLIIALKSVGGFHLICDATNSIAVQQLRDRKRRQSKPFAVMVTNRAEASRIAVCKPEELILMESSIAPIVLVTKKSDSILAANIAPYLNEIGLTLPSNPLQLMLAAQCNCPLVMTSANGSGLPPAIDNQQAQHELTGIADYFVMHNRNIVQRCDDSVMRVTTGSQVEVLRRSRGLIPDAINLPEGFPEAEGCLAYGGDSKSAFAVGKGRQIIVSQYLGDLSNIETQQQYQNTIKHYCELYQVTITMHVADRHPGYFSHQFARTQSRTVHDVQHHHAHIASCLIENGWRPDQGKVMALALDGLGMGDNDELWGGELFIADYVDYQRMGGLPAIPLVGGDRAAQQPWRSFLGHLKTFMPQMGNDELAKRFVNKPIESMTRAMDKRVNTHTVRSMGRFFDAVAASLGIVFDDIEYEGQAACQLEAMAHKSKRKHVAVHAIPLIDNQLDLATFWLDWFSNTDLTTTYSAEDKAYHFHHVLAKSLAALVHNAQATSGIKHLVLTGGVFHNALLTQLIKHYLAPNIHVLQHQYYSCGDGGLALGQIAIALCQNNLEITSDRKE